MGEVFYFGCWNQPGHYFYRPGGAYVPAAPIEDDNPRIDGRYAPMICRGRVTFAAAIATPRRGEPCADGLFLRHEVNGWTLIQWWDRCQGDTRPGCNSSLIVSGRHDSTDMLAMLEAFFPHVGANLTTAGVKLAEVVAVACG